jgi:hypothetical protein
MLAEDRYPDERIAELCEVSRATLARWKADGSFSARVDEITALYSDRALKFGLARRERRLQVLSDVHERVLTLIDERASDASMVSVPGGSTGLLVRNVKSVGKGEGCQIVNEYTVDTSLLRELRAIEEQIAKELGQWTEKQELTTPPSRSGEPQMDLSKLSIEELKIMRALEAKMHPPGTAGSMPDLSRLSDKELDTLGKLMEKAGAK